jgi:NAD(P)-dependent dehydrogenase (short-subunit alcohol dehydrogenase family)
MKLSDKVALITGAGSGIGRATARLFAQEGAKIAVADVNPDDGQRTVSEITQSGGDAIFVEADVSRAESVEAMVQKTVAGFGGLDILYNNAGIFPRPVPTHELSEELWNRVIATNLTGVWLGCKYATPELIKRGGGAIVNTASLAGLRARAYQAPYVASKGAVIMLTKTLALELAPHNIRVNCVCPGGTDTPMLRPPHLTDEQVAERRPAALRHLPMQRMAQPEEIAAAVLYLVSADASYVNGHALVVDGGEFAGTTEGLRR